MIQVGLLCLLVVYSLKFLLKILMRHDIVIAAQRLDNLVAVLVDNN